jgi:hypothetical protein
VPAAQYQGPVVGMIALPLRSSFCLELRSGRGNSITENQDVLLVR